MTFLEQSLTEHIDGSTQVVYETTTDRIKKLPNGDRRIDLSVHNEFPFGMNELKNALDHNPWLGCDYHIENEKQCDMHLTIINRYVKSEDHFIILGDLDARHNEPKFSIVERFVRGLKTKNIYLLLGNNDSFPVKDYQRVGFKAVFTEFAYRDIVLSHFPVGAADGKINIHAHLHGAGNPENKGLDAYWFCDGRNCIDVWDDEYRPIRLQDIMEKFSGLHVNESTEEYIGLNTLEDSAVVCPDAELVEESVFIKHDTIYHNINSVRAGTPNNMIFITGFPGAGKTTTMETLQQKYHNIIGISMDFMMCALADKRRVNDWREWLQEKEAHPFIIDFLDENKNKIQISSGNLNDPILFPWYIKFFEYVTRRMESPEHSNSIAVFEGTQILNAFRYDTEYFDDKALIILGASLIMAYCRKLRRDFLNPHDFSWRKFKKQIQVLPVYFDYNKIMEVMYNKYKDNSDGLHIIKETEIMEESVIFSKKNLELNLGLWTHKKSNILYITGLSGSGKTTLSKKYDEDNVIEFDGLTTVLTRGINNLPHPELIHPTITAFINDQPEFERLDWGDFDKLSSYCTAYVEYLEKHAIENNERYVLEGVQIYFFLPASYFENRPLIVMGTSLLKSTKRRVDRANQKEEGQRFKHFVEELKNLPIMLKNERKLNTWEKELLVTEAVEEIYYRITYRGEGVYQALKAVIPPVTWKKLQLSSVFDWLPKPPIYLDGMKSYFTKLGLEYFNKYTRPAMENYLDKRLIITETKEGPMNIVYRDKYQVVEDDAAKPKDDSLWRSILRFNYDTNNMNYYMHNKNYQGPADAKAFEKYYYVLTPKEFAHYEGGVCWDYVAYQADYFKKNYPSLDYKVFYIASIHEDPDDIPTHTFMLFKYEGKWFWFESSWKAYIGIWEFSSIPAALTYIANAHKIHAIKEPGISRFKETTINEYNPLDKTLFGLNCVEFMERMAGIEEYTYPKRSRLPAPKHYYDEAQYMDINGTKTITESMSKQGGEEGIMDLEMEETGVEILNEQGVIMTEEAQWSTVNRYPIYIVLQHSGTPMANIIKKVTGDEYSHAAIAFNTRLDPLYSFGTKTLKPLTLGFSVQRRGDPFYKDFTVSYGVYVMYLDKRQYDKVMEKLRWFIQNDNKLGYSIPGLITCGLQIPHQFKNKFVCSHFVMTLIGEGTKLPKDPSIWKPQDITTLNNISLVNKGDNFRFYREAVTIENVRKVRAGKSADIHLVESVEECEVIDGNNINSLDLPRPNPAIAYTEEAYDYYLEQANYNKRNIYPVFIILTAADSPMAKAIIKITKQPWSHALISFNTKLDPAYSFGCTSFKPLRFGFISSNDEDPFRDSEQAKFAVYAMYVNKGQYLKMQKKIREFIANKDNLKYSWRGLPRLLTKQTKEYENEFFCSQFVMKIIGEAFPIDKDPQLWTPGDIEFLKNISLAASGSDLRKFKSTILSRNLKYIQKKQFDKVKLECAVEIEKKMDDIVEQLYLETTIDPGKNFFKDRISPRVDNILSTNAGKQRFNQIVNAFIDRNITKLTKSGPCDMVAFTDRDHKALFDLFGFAYTIDTRPRVTSPNEITALVKEFSKTEGISLKFFETNPSQVLLYYVIRYFTMNFDQKSLNSALSIYALCVYPLMFHKYFPYGVIEPFMQYTIDNLTDKFIIKKSKHVFGALMQSIQNSYEFHKKNFPKGNDAHMVAWVERIRNDQNSLFKKISNEYNKNYKEGNAARQSNEQFDRDTPIVDEIENATTVVQNLVQKVALPIIESGVDLLRAEAAAKMGGVSVSDCRHFLTNILISKNVTTMQTFIEAILFLYIYEDKKTERDIRSQYFLAWAASLFKKTNSKNKNINTINTILNEWAEDSGVYKKFIREASRINYKKAIFYYVILCIQKNI